MHSMPIFDVAKSVLYEHACFFSLYLIFICSKFILQIIVDLQIKNVFIA